MRSLIDIIKGSLRQPQTYSAVSSASLEKSSRTSDDDTLNSQDDSSALMGDEAHYPLYHPRRRFSILAVITATCALMLTAVGAFLFGRAWQPHIDEKCMKHSSSYSTVMDEIPNELHEVTFNGTLGKNSDFSGHWGDPNEAMDRNWHKWGFVKYASFTPNEFVAMGLDLDGSARFTEEYGGGGYIGFLEISHQMHCLNVIRQAYHREYYERPENKIWATWLNDRPITIKVHINHCFEMFRQLIMCNSDVGVIPHHWVKDIQDPYANFNTVHKCRDLDSVAEWIEKHEVPPAPETGYPMPAGSKVWPRPP
ncbi:hypothetical protein F4781DRAFT_419940 [Annulohypoxylon bovei var. microspora]|nr:hypothetical protein F4781DRAFT_419940 [Annulohypoxylon bovei var. microspora]